MNENHQLCAQCGGACCKWLSGCMMPDDVFRLFPAPTLREALTQCFQSGTYVVDWWEGDPRNLDYDDPEHLGAAYYVRPRTDEDKRRLYNAGWGGRCVLLGERGCQLPAEQRPYQCRMLEPRRPRMYHARGG